MVIKLKIMLQVWEEISFSEKKTTINCEISIRIWIWTAPKVMFRKLLCDFILSKQGINVKMETFCSETPLSRVC